MRTFYEEWKLLENNSSVVTDEIHVLQAKSSVTTDEITKINTAANSAVTTVDFEADSEIRQLQLANLPSFPLCEFLSISYGKEKRDNSKICHHQDDDYQQH